MSARHTIERQLHSGFNMRGQHSWDVPMWQILDAAGDDVGLPWRLMRDAKACAAALDRGDIVADNGLDLEMQFDRYRWDREQLGGQS